MMIVDNIYLEDLINFQNIEFELIKGHYWDGKKDYRIQEEIFLNYCLYRALYKSYSKNYLYN